MAEASSETERKDTLSSVAALARALGHEKRLQLLEYLSEPRYIEEIASMLGVARQTAEKHAQQLLELGLVRRQEGHRATGRVVEYVLVPQRLFVAADAIANIGAPRTKLDEDKGPLFRTEPGDVRAPLGLDGHPRLVLVHGRGVGRSFTLPPSGTSFVLGRDPECAICLDYDPFISYRHAEIARGPRGLEIADALSRNGTFANGHRLERGARQALRHGDLVGVGRSLLLFRIEG